jgi:beta-N-acetylhexosaminidase
VIRGEIGFDGLLMSDDVSMGALEGPISVRTKAALFAGCDVVLHCNGKLEEMKEVAREAKSLEGASLKRAEHALALLSEADPFDPAGAEARLTELLGTPA